MGTTTLDAEKMRALLAKTVNPFGIVKDFKVGRVQGIVIVNGEQRLFDIDGLVLEAVPRVNDAPAPAATKSRFTPPAGLGKVRMAAVNGELR